MADDLDRARPMPDDYMPAITITDLEPGKIRMEARAQRGLGGPMCALAAEVTDLGQVAMYFNTLRKSVWYSLYCAPDVFNRTQATTGGESNG